MRVFISTVVLSGFGKALSSSEHSCGETEEEVVRCGAPFQMHHVHCQAGTAWLDGTVQELAGRELARFQPQCLVHISAHGWPVRHVSGRIDASRPPIDHLAASAPVANAGRYEVRSIVAHSFILHSHYSIPEHMLVSRCLYMRAHTQVATHCIASEKKGKLFCSTKAMSNCLFPR